MSRISHFALPSLAALAALACAPGPDTRADAGTPSQPLADAGSSAPVDAGAPSDVERVYQMLTGRFDSSAQSRTQPQFFAVQLHTCPVDLPLIGEQVLYVEQAMVSSLSAPYRQRLYAVTAGTEPGTVVSTVYELVQPERFVGLCAGTSDTAIDALDAIARPGCEVVLQAEGEDFVGGTVGTGCESSLNGARYATSEVTLSAEQIVSWDRGYDASDAQVWGSTAGAYVFDRLE